MILCLDSSVLCKLFRYEDGSENINSIMNISSGDLHLIASDLVIYEIGNFLWKMSKRGMFFPDESIDSIYGLDIEFVPLSKEVAEKALTLSKEWDLTYYDAVHIALARSRNSPLVTADKELLSESDDTIDLKEALNIIDSQIISKIKE